SNNLRQLGVATLECNDKHRKLPPMFGQFAGFIGDWRPWIPDKWDNSIDPPALIEPAHWGDPVDGSTVFAHLLPYLDQQNLYKQAVRTWREPPTWGDNHNALRNTFIRTFKCYADRTKKNSSWAVGNYAANYQIFSIRAKDGWQGDARLPSDVPDGLASTIFFAEKYNTCGSGGSLWAIGKYNEKWMAMFAKKSTGKAS